MKQISITPWQIESRDHCDRSYLESIFSQGNGYMGMRGYRPDARGEHPAWRATFISGFYEYVRPGITDMVNQPDLSKVQFWLNGKDSESHGISDFVQTLDMRKNLVSWHYILTDEAGNQTEIIQERFLSMADRRLAAIRLRFTPLNWEGSIVLSGGIDASVENLPIADDQLTENIEFAHMWGEVRTSVLSMGGLLEAETKTSGRKVVMAYILRGAGASNTQVADREVITTIVLNAKTGVAQTVEKLIAVATYRDGRPEAAVMEKVQKLKSVSFDTLLHESTRSWDAIWEDADVKIIGNDPWQGAIRYNISQLVQAMPYKDFKASIGARGLTHGRYKGCYFWDTEIFMLPFFAYTHPEAARSLLMYRYHTLPDALESAKGFSAKGARYSWMSSDTGFEQCETWDTGCCEIHITADIAHAIARYWEQTGDDDFMKRYGTEILLQTARYWVDRSNYSKAEDRYHLLFVKGPDEYCGVTMDDFYTVSMMRDNLLMACAAVAWMEQTYPEEWKKLKKKVDFIDNEPLKWREIASKVVLLRNESTLIWKQDATFELLEPLDITTCKDDNIPLYHKISFDRLQRYQVLKQPAVLMYMALRPEKFKQEEIEAAWDYYEPKTLHDSTLSFGIHALLAARLGKSEQAVAYFEKSLFLDLQNVMKNTAKEGIHTASLGATWQALVLGFGGLSLRNGVLSVANRLPAEIEEMHYTVYNHGKKYRVHIQKGKNAEISETEA